MEAADLDKRMLFLTEITGALDSLQVEYRLGTGALLGAVRDGDFIPWDWDIGLDIPAEQLLASWGDIIDAAVARGFILRSTEKTPLNGKICVSKSSVEFELMGWRRDLRAHRRRRRLFIPAAVWDGPPSRMTFKGLTVSTYPDPERYLQHFYGNWRTPVQATTSSAKSSYLSSDVLVRDYLDTLLYIPNFLRRFLLRASVPSKGSPR